MNSCRFLLVDDEKDFIETIALRLRQRGFLVDCAFSGKNALERLDKDSVVDIIVLDVGMAHPDGIKTLQIIKNKYPLLEVIMLTGEATVHTAVAALKLGAFDYLTKPCHLHDLIAKAEQAFSRKKERQAKILDVRMKPYISEEQRAEMIADILDD